MKNDNLNVVNTKSKSLMGAIDRLETSPDSNCSQEEWSNWSGDFDNWQDSHRNIQASLVE